MKITKKKAVKKTKSVAKKFALSKLDPLVKIYGDSDYRDKKSPKEAAEQITIFNHLRLKFPELAVMATHIKNEGLKTPEECRKDAMNGLCKGFADIHIAGHPAFYCELKRDDITQSTISKEQETFLLSVQNSGGFACVALGHKGFFAAFGVWLKLQKNKNGNYHA